MNKKKQKSDKNKAELLEMYTMRKPTFNRLDKEETRLHYALRNYMRPSSDSYDASFAAKIVRVKWWWFVKKHEAREMLAERLAALRDRSNYIYNGTAKEDLSFDEYSDAKAAVATEIYYLDRIADILYPKRLTDKQNL